MEYSAESEIKGVFDERFEEYTEKAAGIWSLSCTDSCLCSGDCNGCSCGC